MINSNELRDFVVFCQKEQQIKIDQSIVNVYLEYRNSMEQQEKINSGRKEPEETKCGTHGIGCSYVALNTVKCGECVN